MTKTDIFKLKQSISFEDLLFNLGFENINVNMKRCSCLLHGGDNKTSFSWNNDVFYCYGCGKSGDKISLVQEVKKYSFQEALQYLGNLAGIPIDIKPGKKQRVDYSRYNENMFPTRYCEMLAKKTILEYWDNKIDLIQRYIDIYSNIARSLKVNNVPEFEKRIEHTLYRLDSLVSCLIYERNML